MTPGERFKNWIDELSDFWKERLRGFMISFLSLGMDTFFRILGKSAAPKLKPIIDRLEATGEVPPEIQLILDEMKNPTGEAAAMFAQTAGGSLVGGAVGKILDAILLPLAYGINSSTQYAMLDENKIIAAWRRGDILADEEMPYLHRLGLSDYWINILQKLTETRLDPMTVITAWRRDPDKYAKYLKDLFDQGYNWDRIDALKFATQFYPNPADLVNWQAKEVFEPDMISRYGLDSEYGNIDKEPFYKAGMTDEQILNYWRAHWEHASWNQVVEMLHRGQMTESEVWDWFRLVEIPPFWRDKLIHMAYNVPTRVDVRRFYDLKTIDEARLREIYASQGYFGKDLDDYVLWTKIYVDLPDLLARWKNGWISLDEVRTTLIADGMQADAADELIQTKVKSVEPSSTAEGKELTKAEIYKGVLQGVVTYEEGVELLMDLDYSRDQADYLLITNVAVLTGSPETYTDFKEITQKYRQAAGLGGKPVTEELKAAAAAVVELTKELETIKQMIADEERTLVDEPILPKEATEELDKLRACLYQVETKLTAARMEYDKHRAVFKHTPP